MCGSSLSKVVKVATLGLVDMEPPKPPTPPKPDAPIDAPTEVDPGVTQAREDERKRRAAAAGAGSTILTGASGLNTAAQTGQKTLLGA
jgi:hypothetical protein